MAILVTGGAGYIGSVTVESLLSRGENVVVLDNLSRGHRQALASKAIFYEGNVGDGNLLTRITEQNEIESCIHFAAFAYVGESVERPRQYFENNVEQGIALFGSLLQVVRQDDIIVCACEYHDFRIGGIRLANSGPMNRL
jgi:UDP-glucose 4-epimerase